MSVVISLKGRRKSHFSELAVRMGGSLTTLAAHGVVGLWLIYESPAPMAEPLPPTAIMIELAESPEAINTEQNEVSLNQQSSQESLPAEKSDTQLESQDDIMPDEVAEPQEDTPTPVVEETPSPKKRAPAKRKPPKKETPTDELKSSDSQAASQQLIAAQAQVTASDVNAAPQSVSSNVPPSRMVVTWQSRLMAHLERRKRYPYGARSRGETGIVYVQFNIDDSGNVLSQKIARSSGFLELDNEVLSLVRRASPVPKPPLDAPRTIIAPVEFTVRISY